MGGDFAFFFGIWILFQQIISLKADTLYNSYAALNYFSSFWKQIDKIPGNTIILGKSSKEANRHQCSPWIRICCRQYTHEYRAWRTGTSKTLVLHGTVWQPKAFIFLANIIFSLSPKSSSCLMHFSNGHRYVSISHENISINCFHVWVSMLM